MSFEKDISAPSPSLKNQPFFEPLFHPSIDDIRAVFIDAFLMTHYLHTNYPSVLNDTLSLRDLRFRRTASHETVCILVDLDGKVHPSNPDGRPSTHGTIPFNAYDAMLAPRGEASNKWYHRPSLYSPCDGVNTAAPYQTYRHIAEALFYLLLWCVSSGVSDGMSGWTGQTMEWIECGYVELHPLLRVLKHRKEREAFMWDPAEMFAKIDAQFVPLAGWVWPLWRLLSDAHFWCRFCPKEKKNRHLDSVLTFNKIVKIIRGNGDFDLRIGTLLPLPCEDSDEL